MKNVLSLLWKIAVIPLTLIVAVPIALILSYVIFRAVYTVLTATAEQNKKSAMKLDLVNGKIQEVLTELQAT